MGKKTKKRRRRKKKVMKKRCATAPAIVEKTVSCELTVGVTGRSARPRIVPSSFTHRLIGALDVASKLKHILHHQATMNKHCRRFQRGGRKKKEREHGSVSGYLGGDGGEGGSRVLIIAQQPLASERSIITIEYHRGISYIKFINRHAES